MYNRVHKRRASSEGMIELTEDSRHQLGMYDRVAQKIHASKFGMYVRTAQKIYTKDVAGIIDLFQIELHKRNTTQTNCNCI